MDSDDVVPVVDVSEDAARKPVTVEFEKVLSEESGVGELDEELLEEGEVSVVPPVMI